MVPGDIPRRKFIAASAAGITAVWLGAKWIDLDRAVAAWEEAGFALAAPERVREPRPRDFFDDAEQQ